MNDLLKRLGLSVLVFGIAFLGLTISLILLAVTHCFSVIDSLYAGSFASWLMKNLLFWGACLGFSVVATNGLFAIWEGKKQC